jgi:bacteriorhodopsin
MRWCVGWSDLHVGKLSWRDRHGDSGTCIRCLEVKDMAVLDRLFWCEQCRERAMRRATRIGRIFAMAVTLLLVLWIAVFVQPDRDLILSAWVVAIAAMFYLSMRISREVAYGSMRLLNRRAVEAVPPSQLPGRPEPNDEEGG